MKHDVSASEHQRHREQSNTYRNIAEAINGAQRVLNRYEHQKKKLAYSNQDPTKNNDIYELHIKLDTAAYGAYDKLRSYLRDELRDRYWNKKILGVYHDDTWILLGGNDYDTIQLDGNTIKYSRRHATISPDDNTFNVQNEEIAITDIYFFEDFQGEYIKTSHTNYEAYRGEVQQTDHQPLLLPIPIYRRAIRLLDEAFNDLGFGPEPTVDTGPKTNYYIEE